MDLMPGKTDDQKISDIADSRIQLYVRGKRRSITLIGATVLALLGFLGYKKDDTFKLLFNDTVVSMVNDIMNSKDGQIKSKTAYTSQAHFKIIPSKPLYNYYYLPFYADTTRSVLLDVNVNRGNWAPPTQVLVTLDDTSIGLATNRNDFDVTASIHDVKTDFQKIKNLHQINFISLPNNGQQSDPNEEIDITCSVRVLEGKLK
jgi:hypothetical protein